jgi:hypothetical protein
MLWKVKVGVAIQSYGGIHVNVSSMVFCIFV